MVFASTTLPDLESAFIDAVWRADVADLVPNATRAATLRVKLVQAVRADPRWAAFSASARLPKEPAATEQEAA